MSDRETYAEYLNAAINALVLDELPPATIERLAADLVETGDELGGNDGRQQLVLGEWLRRIGGWANVPEYARVLAAGDRRRQLQAN